MDKKNFLNCMVINITQNIFWISCTEKKENHTNLEWHDFYIWVDYPTIV